MDQSRSQGNMIPLAKVGDNTGLLLLLEQEGVQVDAADSEGWTSLMAAATHGQATTVNILLLKGADANRKDIYGFTALICVAGASHASSTMIARALLQHGAAAGDSTKSGITALMRASWHGNKDIVCDILARDVCVDAADSRGMTALMCAAWKGHPDIIEALLSHGANPNLADTYGWTALMRAATEGYADIIEKLASNNCDINASNKNGQTALMIASREGHVQAVSTLINTFNANTDINDSKGRTAMQYALEQGHAHVVDILSNS